MKKLLLVLLLLPTLVFADTKTLAWDPVTTDVNGNSITVTGYKIYVSQTSGSYTAPAYGNVVGATTSTLTKTVPGTYYVVATAYITEGNVTQESAYSNEVSFTVVAGKPAAVKNLKITSP